jgi:branched-chain amino acid transport system substrate-binding protein
MVFKNAGVEFETITAAPGTPDLIPQLQSAVDSGADVIGLTGDVTFCTSFLQAYETLALDVPKYVIAPCVDPTVVDSLGGVLAGSYLATISSSGGEDAETYGAIVEKYGAGEDIDTDPQVSAGVAAGTQAVINLVRAMEGLSGEVTKDTVMAQMKAAKDVPLWLAEGQTFTCDGTAISIMPNVCSAEFFVGTLDEEGQVTDPESVNAAALFEM